jgi:hypothetical protein
LKIKDVIVWGLNATLFIQENNITHIIQESTSRFFNLYKAVSKQFFEK